MAFKARRAIVIDCSTHKILAIKGLSFSNVVSTVKDSIVGRGLLNETLETPLARSTPNSAHSPRISEPAGYRNSFRWPLGLNLTFR